MSNTIKNLETALAGESQAHIKYLYFANLAESRGEFDVADHFYDIAEQEIKHAHSHLNLLIGKPESLDMIQMAIDGETYEYTVMYPEMKAAARVEGRELDAKEAQTQAKESLEHAEGFRKLLASAEKKFSALARIEQRHAGKFQQLKEQVE